MSIRPRLLMVIDEDMYFVQRILPDKLRLAEEYVRRSSLALDLTLIFKTLVKLIPGQTASALSRPD